MIGLLRPLAWAFSAAALAAFGLMSRATTLAAPARAAARARIPDPVPDGIAPFSVHAAPLGPRAYLPYRSQFHGPRFVLSDQRLLEEKGPASRFAAPAIGTGVYQPRLGSGASTPCLIWRVEASR